MTNTPKTKRTPAATTLAGSTEVTDAVGNGSLPGTLGNAPAVSKPVTGTGDPGSARDGGLMPPALVDLLAGWKIVDARTQDAWLDARKIRLTASDAPKVLGARSFGGRAKVVADKAFPPDLSWSGNLATRLGQFLEPCVIDAFAFEAGLTVVQLRWPGAVSMLIDHPTIPALAASPDGVVIGPTGDPVAVVEIKVTSNLDTWSKESEARTQIQVQCDVCELPGGWLVVNAGTKMWFKYVPAEMGFRTRLEKATKLFWQDVIALRNAKSSTTV